MEFLNKIEIAGVVGRANLTPCGPTTVCNFSVMTEYCYKGNDGGVVVVIGRLRAKRYCDAQGIDRVCYDVVAQELGIMEE